MRRISSRWRGEGQQPHDVDGHALGGLGDTGAAAMGAVFVDRALQAGADSLASHFDQAEGAHAEDLGPSPVALDGLAQGPLHAAAMPLLAHVDEVVDDHAAQVAKPELPGDLLGGPQVHFVGGSLGIVLDPEIARVDVDGNQGLGLVDHDRAPFRKRHMPALDLGDLVLDAVLVKKGHFFVIELEAVDETRHDDLEEVLGRSKADGSSIQIVSISELKMSRMVRMIMSDSW